MGRLRRLWGWLNRPPGPVEPPVATVLRLPIHHYQHGNVTEIVDRDGRRVCSCAGDLHIEHAQIILRCIHTVHEIEERDRLRAESFLNYGYPA